MSGMMTSDNTVVITRKVGELTNHIVPAQHGDWFYLRTLRTVGKILPRSAYPLFEFEEFYYFYVPWLNAEVSLHSSEFDGMPLDVENWSDIEVGCMARIDQWYLDRMRAMGRPVLIKDEPDGYEGEFPLTKDDVGRILEFSPFHAVIQFAAISMSNYDTDRYHTDRYHTDKRIGRDCIEDSMLVWDDDAPEERKVTADGEVRTLDKTCWPVHVAPEEWCGDTIVIPYPFTIPDYGEHYHSSPLTRVDFCQECGYLCERDDMRSMDEYSETALSGGDCLSLCDGCYDSDTYEYSFLVIGEEGKDENEYHIGKHDSNLEDAPDIVHDFVSRWDFKEQQLQDVNSRYFLRLDEQSGWSSNVEWDFDKYTAEKIQTYFRKRKSYVCNFTILRVNTNAYYIRRSEVCAFAAWLQKQYRKGTITRSHHPLTDYMPTKGQIIVAFQHGDEPTFAVDTPDVWNELLVTVRLLKSLGACSNQVAMFAEVFPQGVKVTVENIMIAQSAGLDLDWMSSHVLTTSWCRRYREAHGPSRKAQVFFEGYWHTHAGSLNITVTVQYDERGYDLTVLTEAGTVLATAVESLPLTLDEMYEHVKGVYAEYLNEWKQYGFMVGGRITRKETVNV